MEHAQKRVAMALAWQDPGHTAGITQYACRARWILQQISPVNLHSMRSFRPHGIICQLYKGVPDMVNEVRALQVPFVEMGSALPDMVVPRVMPDTAAEGRAAAEHLIARGYTRLVYIGDCRCGQQVGFAAAALAAGLSITIIDTNDPDVQRETGWHAGHVSFVHDDISPLRRAWTRTFFSRCQLPVGVHTWDLAWAVDIIDGCREADILVPEQVAVVASTTYPNEGQAFPLPLTSIASNYEQQGYKAAELLNRILDGEPIAADTVVRVPPRAIEPRESTMCYATENLPVARAATFIMRNLHDLNLSAKQICLGKGVSRCVLYRDFRAHFKMPIAHYIEQLRVEDAKQMLAHTRATAEEIATGCGFGDVLRFRRAFKRVTKTTPGRYRGSHVRADQDVPSPPWHHGPWHGFQLVSKLVSNGEPLAVRVLKLLATDTLGKKPLSLRLGNKGLSGQLNKVIHTLLSTHAIEWTIPHKPNSRLQQYRLTEKGRLLIAESLISGAPASFSLSPR